LISFSPGQLKVATKTTGTGYVIEAAIAWSYIGGQAPLGGKLYGFDIAIDDRDNNARESELMWVNAASYWTNPSAWGDLTLSGAGGSSCDVNGDGSVSVLDVQSAVNQVLTVAPCGRGDVDGNGRCEVTDVQRVINAIMSGVCITGP
jgi:hypothetical protein